MSIFLYNFFHNETNDRTEKGLVHIPKDVNEWPESWKKVVYKRYSLFKPIILSKEKGNFFKELLSKRKSGGDYFLNNKLTLSKLSYILQCGYGLQGGAKEEGREENRTVPSGGKRYPLEIYIFLFKQIDECEPGIYHYGVKGHTLEPIAFKHFSREEVLSISPKESLQNAFGMICITSVFDRVTDKYGSRGYRYCLLEAGHVAQNMLLAGTENDVNMIPIGSLNEKEVEKILGLNSSNERVIYALFL